MGRDGCASTVATESNNKLTIDFIFEVSNGGGEAPIHGHVRIADEPQPQRKRKGFGKRLLLKNAAADDLSANSGQDLVVARRENVNPANLGFLMQLLGAKLHGFTDAFILRLVERRF